METINDISSELINNFNNRLKLTLNEDKNTINISSEIKLLFLFNFEKDLAIFIVNDINKLSIDLLNEKKDEILKNNIFKGKQLIFYVISLKFPSKDFKKELNKNNYYTFFDDVLVRLSAKIIEYYISYQDKNKYLFKNIINEYDKVMSEYKDHIENKSYSLLSNHYWINDVYPFLEITESDYLNWEKIIIQCILTPEYGKYYNSSEFYGKTFKPSYSFIDNNGEKSFYPNVDNLKNEVNIEEYFFNRLNSTNSLLLKYRYYELLLYWNSKKIIKPDCFKNIISILKNIIIDYKNNKNNFTYLYLSIMPYYQRIFEIYNKYFNSFDSAETEEIINYYIDTLKDLEKNKEHRWILDFLEILTFYDKININLKNYNSYFYKLLEDGIKYYQNENDSNLEISYIECYQNIKKIYKENDDSIFIELKAESYKNEAFRKINENNYIAAIHFIKLARDQFLPNENKYKEKINEIDKYSKEWHKLSLKEMKKVETKIDTVEIKKQYDNYISDLSKLSKNEIIQSFFSNYNLIMSEESFYKSLKITENSLVSLLASTSLLGEERTIFSPQNEDEKKELEKWLWYGRMIQIYLPWITYIFNIILEKDFIKIEDIIIYISSSININIDDKNFIIEGFKTYEKGFYSSSISLLIPLIERYFRYYKSETGEDIKHTKNKSYYDIKLDQMILNSENFGIPGNIVLFARYFFTQERGGYNLRNNLSHGLLKYDTINNKGLNEIVLWFICLCYLNLKINNKITSAP